MIISNNLDGQCGYVISSRVHSGDYVPPDPCHLTDGFESTKLTSWASLQVLQLPSTGQRHVRLAGDFMLPRGMNVSGLSLHASPVIDVIVVYLTVYLTTLKTSHRLHNMKKKTGAPRWQSSFSSTLTVRWLIQIGQIAVPGCNLLGLYCHLVGRRDNTQRPCLACLKFPFTYTVPSRLTHSCVVQITQWYKPEILFVLTLSFWSSVIVVTVLLNFNYMLHNALFLRLQNKFQIKNGFILCPSL